MKQKIQTQREKDKKNLLKEAAKQSAILQETGIKQGVHAERIGTSQRTLSKFMSGDPDYVTASLVQRVKVYIAENISVEKIA
jgi:DNA-binding transcriptional regulator YiaG